LVFGERLEHFGLLARVVLLDEPVNEGRMDTGRAKAVAADPTLHVVRRDTERHGKHGALAHLVREAVGDADERGDRGDVEDGAALAVGKHALDAILEAVEDALDVDVVHAVHVRAHRREDVADMSDPRVVHEDVHAPPARTDGVVARADRGLVRDIAMPRPHLVAAAKQCVDLGRWIRKGVKRRDVRDVSTDSERTHIQEDDERKESL
jgi:hypothetical protein